MVMRPAMVEFLSSGECVIARFGNVEVKIKYEDAFLISHWLVYRSLQAKRFAGDGFGFNFRALGTMHDANIGDGPPDNGKLIARNEPILKKSSWEISTVGSKVLIKFGSNKIEVHYRDASIWAQWIRIRAKEAKRRAGDVSRHWGTIGKMHDIEYGSDVTRG